MIRTKCIKLSDPVGIKKKLVEQYQLMFCTMHPVDLNKPEK